jgi:hypothetical protein
MDTDSDYIAPPKPGDVLDALRHVVEVYGTAEDDRQVLDATFNFYGRGSWTGLTMGDLRSLHSRLATQEKSTSTTIWRIEWTHGGAQPWRLLSEWETEESARHWYGKMALDHPRVSYRLVESVTTNTVVEEK